MSAAERRRGRRDNGLDASDWRAIEDLDPRVSEEVLAALAARGIAAYVQPAADIDPITRSTTVPSRPTDRLYVDRQHLQAAKDCLRGVLERSWPATTEVDAVFAGIVADFHRSDPTVAPWPALEDAPTDPEPRPEPEPTRPPTPVDARHVTESSLLDGLDTFGADLPDEQPPDRFVPPPPPPLPRLSRQAVLGTLAILAGLVLLLGQPAALPLEATTMILVGFAMVLGGAVALILRLRPDPGEDDDPPLDDGAQV